MGDRFDEQKRGRVVDFRMEMEQTKEGIHNFVEKAFASNRMVAQPRGLRNLISNLADRIETRSKLSMVERARNSRKEREGKKRDAL